MKFAQPLKTGWLIILISLVTLLNGCAVKGKATANQKQGTLVQLSKIEPRDSDGKTEITIEGTEPILMFTSFPLTDPPRQVVDITDADIGKFQDKIVVNNGAIIDITPSQKDNIARLEIALAQVVDVKVYQAGGKLIIETIKPVEVAKTSPEAVTAPPVQETPQVEKVEAPQPQPELAAATVVSAVQASAGKEGTKVVITGDGLMKPNTFMVGKLRLVVDIPGVKSRVKPSVIPVRKGGLDKVRVGQHSTPEQKVRVVLDLKKPLEYTVTTEGNTLIIAMGTALAIKKEEPAPQERAAAQEPEKAPVEKEKEVKEAVAVPVAPQEAAPVPPPVKPFAQERVESTRSDLGAPETALLEGGNKFSGRKISLDLQDADLINVMRLFAEVANLNIVLAPDVKGKITVRMVNIPWDQAMDIILRMNGMGYALENNILRISTVTAMTKEAEEELKSKEAKKKAEDLITRIIPINYAKVTDPNPKPGDIISPPIETALRKSLSARGDITADTRTNTLIIKDIARNVEEIVSLIKVLDKPNPQVMIEARIVEASLNFNKDIGVQWGGAASSSASTGNSTGLSFPNTVNVTGGSSMGATSSGGNYIVNLPATANSTVGGGSVGFSFGSLSKALNLDLVLSAMESTGEGKIISTPRVSALDNREAKIEQGLSIPYTTISAAGTLIEFKKALISLVVTPHVTPDNKIFMKLVATKNAPDTSILGASGQPSIRENNATTEILLSDGETAVIGGIIVVDRSTTDYKIPFFGDIPLIGWLFRRSVSKEEKKELIIFVTPKIIKQEVV